MNFEEIIKFIEDKDFEISENWYLHATSNNITVIKKILQEGIKCAHLINEKPRKSGYTGKYYISLYKSNELDNELNQWLDNRPKLVINYIEPLYAPRKEIKLRRIFVNTRIPLRTSEWDGEYQQYLLIDSSKFVAVGYDISHILKDIYCSDKLIRENLLKEKFSLLRDIIQSMNETNNNLPIYDFSTQKEINKNKVLSLHIL